MRVWFMLLFLGIAACSSSPGNGEKEGESDTDTAPGVNGESGGLDDGDSGKDQETDLGGGNDTTSVDEKGAGSERDNGRESESESDRDDDIDGDSNGTPDDGRDSDSDLQGDADSDERPDTEAEDTDGRGDTTPTVFCPEGSVLHTTSSGKTVCCNDAYPVFCDENEDGYTGGCWTEGVSCEGILFCGEQWLVCTDGALPYCDENGDLICYPCEDETRLHETTSGRPVCCTDARPKFCDENSAGYTGGCWSEETDCETITSCDDTFYACSVDTLPHCQDDGVFRCYPCEEGSEVNQTLSGRPVCCPPENPIFCDENEAGYDGGCWWDTIDCDTIIECNGVWGACETGRTSSCEENTLRCLEAT